MAKANQDKWANFLMNDGLDAAKLPPGDVLNLMELCRALGEAGSPYPNGMAYPERLKARVMVVGRAMDMGLDLSAITVKGRVAMGRGLLDVWVTEYRRRFGTATGTAGEAEQRRRDVRRAKP